jgi:hypothetical protein
VNVKIKQRDKINDAWKMWDKTRKPKYKELWYKLIKEWADGRNNTTRRAISSLPSDKRFVHRGDFTRNY